MIFAFYTSGVLIFAFIKDTEYFNGEDGVVIPKHVLAEHAKESDAEGKQIRAQ